MHLPRITETQILPLDAGHVAKLIEEDVATLGHSTAHIPMTSSCTKASLLFICIAQPSHKNTQTSVRRNESDIRHIFHFPPVDDTLNGNIVDKWRSGSSRSRLTFLKVSDLSMSGRRRKGERDVVSREGRRFLSV